MEKKLILVTGANGYIAGKLVPRLLDTGYAVRCMVRDPQKIAHQPWAGQVDVVAADVTQTESLNAALQQVHTAYYLIHNMSSGHGYQQAELDGANNFAQAAARAKVQHIIYLGGLADPKAEIAPHMRSRIETGKVLRENEVPVTEFRAGVIVGPGSISFEMIRFLCEQFPILIGPSWLKNRTQPISIKNVIDYLIAALQNPEGRGQVFEIGGNDTFSYGQTMLIYSQIRGLKRWMLTVPTLPKALMALIVDQLTPVLSAIAYPLIEGLNSHSAVTDPKALKVFPEIELEGYHQAVRKSLSQLHPNHLERIWEGSNRTRVFLKSEGFLIDCQWVRIPSSATESAKLISKWCADNLAELEPDEILENRRLLYKEKGGKFGARWVEWELLPGPDGSTALRQISYFAPKGLVGFLSGIKWRARQRRLFELLCKQLGGSG